MMSFASLQATLGHRPARAPSLAPSHEFVSSTLRTPVTALRPRRTAAPFTAATCPDDPVTPHSRTPLAADLLYSLMYSHADHSSHSRGAVEVSRSTRQNAGREPQSAYRSRTGAGGDRARRMGAGVSRRTSGRG